MLIKTACGSVLEVSTQQHNVSALHDDKGDIDVDNYSK